ncbi:hypothetical protein [Streptomyces sp. NRRL S-920]|uniref:hypothetical protein n=1 Tax=Streptomyces sp. NRRL S-920 TaxID=1463921 RepID=UPI00055A7B23|nr:hypothetical protein [Streptomyces sp. NRRL S-920]
MERADFDRRASRALIDERAVLAGARVPAVPDQYGTAALFGDEMPARQAVPRRRVPAEPPQADALF